MKELPFSMFYELINAARKEEAERRIYPLWLAGFAVSKICGKEIPDYKTFLEEVMPANENCEEVRNLAEEERKKNLDKEIQETLDLFLPIVKAYRDRGEESG